MKCPKCGYHSFDYLDSCKKCDNDLTAFKGKYNLRSLIFPHRQTAVLGQQSTLAESAEDTFQPAPPAAAGATDFGFDFMDENDAAPRPEPAKVNLPELEQDLPQIEPTAAPGADDTFSWDDEPEPAPLPPIEAAPSTTDDFDWDDEPAQEAGVEEDAFEEAQADDTFGLDLSWDTDLPALEEDQIEEEEPLESLETGELPEWDFEDEPPPEEKKIPKPKGQEEPSDPFDLRGPGADVPAPSSVEMPARQTELPFAAETDSPPEAAPLATAAPESEALTGAAAPLSPDELEAPQAIAAPDLPLDEPAAATPPSPLLRLLAFGIDLLILSLAILLFLMAGEAALAPKGSRNFLPTATVLLNLAIPYFLVLFSVCFGYFTLFHFLTGQTPGKMLLRLQVTTESGAPLAFSQAFLRSTGGLFSLLCFGLGFLTILFDRRRRGWNDRVAGTLVTATVSARAKEGDTATGQA